MKLRIMKYLLTLLCIVMFPARTRAGGHGGAESENGGELDMQAYIFAHVSDSYEWHITGFRGREIAVPLPVIVWTHESGLQCFSFRRIKEGHSWKGFRMAQPGETHEGKVVFENTDGTLIRPVDISITKNVAGLLVDSVLLVVLVLLCARWYRRHDVLREKPSGLAAFLEPVIVMINDGVIKDVIGDEHRKYSPYLLTAFFFILINNLMGIVPIIPGGANITGNIAVTGVLAVFTFLMVNLFGNRHYYKEIFWPDVPLFLKAIPIMPAIEVLGTLTKPFSLMIRLFANMLAGHIMLLSAIGVIFLTAKMGPVINGSLTIIAFLFGIFLDCLEVLVACIQAYVFTMLSAVFIGLAHQQPEHE